MSRNIARSKTYNKSCRMKPTSAIRSIAQEWLSKRSSRHSKRNINIILVQGFEEGLQIRVTLSIVRMKLCCETVHLYALVI